jgi:hypothetical protein
MWPYNSIWVYTVGYTIFIVSSALCSVPFSGLIVDITVDHQRGLVSAVMGSLQLLGSLVGAGAGLVFDYLGTGGTYGLMSAVLV